MTKQEIREVWFKEIEAQKEATNSRCERNIEKYRKGDKEAGSLGIVGPMRLNYSKIIPYIEYFTQKITEVLSEDDNDDFAGKDTE